MTRPIYDPQPPHDSAVLQTPPHERPISAAAKRFLIERDTYDAYIEPSEAVRAACARVQARTGETA